MACQEAKNDGKLIVLMILAVLSGYFFLVAQYESWTILLPVILPVAFAMFGGVVFMPPMFAIFQLLREKAKVVRT